jgi:hypothetical protein
MNRRYVIIALAASLAVPVLLCASWGVAQGEKSTASIELFREYGDQIAGRWVAEVTLTDDYPGLGKKGDKLTCHSTTTWIADKNALEGEWFIGSATGKWLCYWDGASKTIKQVGADSTGAAGVTEITKVNGKWIEKNVGAYTDGTVTTGTITRTIADNGNTQIADWTDQLIGGKKIQDERDVWKRVSK